jgi:hypothetical protein
MLYSVRAESFLWQDLLGQMSRIREKATESEAVVRDITKDIQVLDLAKKNLITSMTMMKRLQMLGNLPFPGVMFLFLSFSFSSQCIDTTGGLDQGEEVWRSCANFGGACLFTKRNYRPSSQNHPTIRLSNKYPHRSSRTRVFQELIVSGSECKRSKGS